MGLGRRPKHFSRSAVLRHAFLGHPRQLALVRQASHEAILLANSFVLQERFAKVPSAARGYSEGQGLVCRGADGLERLDDQLGR